MDISRRAREIKKIEKKLKDIPDVRGEKVKKLKASINNGSYHVSSKKIAEKLFDDMSQE